MSRGRPTSTWFTSPMLVGCVILALGLMAVVLSYNANKGLPFVATYEVSADVPDAAELTAGSSEVRSTGTRVGIVKAIRAIPGRGGRPAFARLTLALDPYMAGLPVDSTVKVRPRSILGAKYLDLTVGRSSRQLPEGGVLPTRQALPIVELDEAFNVFGGRRANGIRNALTVMGDSLAGRGSALNDTVVSTRRLIGPLGRVMALLASPSTDLEGFIVAAATATRALAGVSSSLGSLVDHAATTLAALDVERDSLAEAIDELPPTETVGIRTLRRINPVLDDAATIAREVRPGVRVLPAASRSLADAVDAGIPVLDRIPGLADRLGETLSSLDALAEDRHSASAVRQLIATVTALRPTLRDLRAAQLQCNVAGLWTRNVPSALSNGDANGAWLTALVVVNPSQMFQSAEPAPDLHLNYYPVENARECEAGNEPFPAGQRIGSPAGRQSNRTERTSPP